MISPYASIRELNKAIKSKHVSSVELTQMYVSRLITLGYEHNAVAELIEAQALTDAIVADSTDSKSLLHGIPFGVKDLLATKGVPTRWGSPGHSDQVFDFDSTVVAKLKSAGGILVAKLEMIELAGGGHYNQADASRRGACKSAWDKSLWAGGSSSGSGAATALGCISYSIGSETSGSITCPSAFNGCTGFRPTYGRVSRFGAMALCWTLDKLGPMTRSAEDAAIVLETIAGLDPLDETTLSQPLNLRSRGPKPKIGLLKEAFAENDAAVCEKAYFNVIDALHKLGYDTVEVEFPLLPYATAVGIIVDAEGASAHENFIRGDRFQELRDPHQVAGFASAMQTKAVDYLWALRMRREALRANAVWETCDCIFTPVFYHRSIPADLPFDQTWKNMGGRAEPSNLLGWPAMAFPIGFEEGAPLGGQLIAPAFREDICFQVVRDFQRNSDFHLVHPPV